MLDITREGVMTQPQDNLSTLMLAAGNIESRLFGLCHREHLVLALHSRPQYLTSAWQAVGPEPGRRSAGGQRQRLPTCRSHVRR